MKPSIGIILDPYGRKHARFGDKKYEILKNHGYSCVDFNISNTDTQMYTCSEDELVSLISCEKRLADKSGITFSQLHGPWRYPPMDSTDEERAERMEKCKRALLVARLIGSKYFVIHPIMPYGTADIALGKEGKTWELNLKFMRELVGYAKEYGITVCLENMPMLGFSVATPERILSLVKAVNDDYFKVCLDTGHVNVFENLSVQDEIRRLGEYVKVLHVHDNLRDKDAHLFPTEGSVDWQGVVGALRDICFEGVFSLEAAPSAELDDETFKAESQRLFSIAFQIIKA